MVSSFICDLFVQASFSNSSNSNFTSRFRLFDTLVIYWLADEDQPIILQTQRFILHMKSRKNVFNKINKNFCKEFQDL